MDIRVFEAFSGYGSQHIALERLMLQHSASFSYSVVGISEIDSNALKAYSVLHGDCPNFGDISSIDWDKVPDFDLFTYSFPCTTISHIGCGTGFTKGSGTASSLLWECQRAIESKKPKYLLMENVKNLLSDKYIGEFCQWLRVLESYGYKNYYKVLDAADYNIPQHRERVFMVSILDADYVFPDKKPLKRRLSDILESSVDDSYYLRDNKLPESTLGVINDTFTGEFPVIYGWVRDSKGIIKNWHPVDIANCVTASKRHNTQNYVKETDGRVRKLTIKECFRLMGLSDADIDKLINANISKTALMKMAGNSIVVDVLYYIFKQMFIEADAKQPIENEQLTLF